MAKIGVLLSGILLVVGCGGGGIAVEDLPDEIVDGSRSKTRIQPGSSSGGRKLSFPAEWLKRPLQEALVELNAEFEKTYLSALLEETGGRVNETAARAGVTPRTLFNKMKQCRLDKHSFKRKRSKQSSR